jgi:integrase
MHSRHIIKRGNHYHFVCRVPQDLLHLFPNITLWKSLKAEDIKAARLLAGAEEYRTQQLFLKLRTGMLDKNLEKLLIALYLKRGVDSLEAQATGEPIGIDKAIGEGFEALGKLAGLSADEARERRAIFNEDIAKSHAALIAAQDTFLTEEGVNGLAARVNKKYDVKLTSAEKKALSLKLLNANKLLHEAESATHRGEWSTLELLKEKVERDLAKPYHDFKTVLEGYQKHYLASKPNVRPGTRDDMVVECRVLLEVIGNINIAEVNTMGTVTKLKTVLQKYPLNKQQRYGDKSIHSIMKTERGYEVIGLKTANEYLKRAKAVIAYANKNQMLNAANVYEGELFRTEVAEEDQRPAYDHKDIERLIHAICTYPLWRYQPAKPERFWIILIALFHGLRLGNIVALTKKDICQTDKGTWIFTLRRGKTKSTVRSVAICDSLQLLGFLEWVERLPREQLFQDSADSFSKWYNRVEKDVKEVGGKKGKKGYEGFESSYVTKDKGKCLYSIRHSFAGNIFDVTEDYKITADMMGHSTGKSVTARYIKRTKAETLKEITEKMQLEYIDIDRLEARAQELFGL